MSRRSEDTQGRGRWRSVFEIVTTLLMLAAASVVVWQNWRPASPPVRPSIALPRTPVDISRAPIKGHPTARVGIVQYSDFECPFCERVNRTSLAELDADYFASGRVLMAFKHLPLPIHEAAQGASEAALCAHVQGRFWPMHDTLFANRKNLTGPALRELAAGIGLQMDRYDECVQARSQKEHVDRDAREAAELGITGTPAFLFGIVDRGRVTVSDVITGARSAPEFRKILDALIVRTSA